MVHPISKSKNAARRPRSTGTPARRTTPNRHERPTCNRLGAARWGEGNVDRDPREQATVVGPGLPGFPSVLPLPCFFASGCQGPANGLSSRNERIRSARFVYKLRRKDPNASEFSIWDLHGLIRKYRVRVVKDYSNGVDFEKPSELEEAVYHAFLALNQSGIPDEDILVDVTGGQKPASIAGAVVALAKQRRIQYISTHDYRVRVYDVEFES